MSDQNNTAFKQVLNTLLKNKILPLKNIPSIFIDHILFRLSKSADFELIIKEQDLDSGEIFYWLGSTYNLKKSLQDDHFELAYPPLHIHKDNIESITLPEDFWWKYRSMRFDDEDYKLSGKVLKLITSPKLMVDFSLAGKRPLIRLERGFTRIMKKRKMLIKKFEKQKKFNQELANYGPHDLILVLDHLKPDFNIGKIFRTAEAFGAKEIHIIATDYFDPSTSVGGFKKVKAFFFETFEESYKRLMELGYTPYCLHSHGENYLHNTKLPEKTAFILGHEEFGPQFDFNEFKNVQLVKIKQFGIIESLNVAVAASIASYEYMRQHILE